MYKEVKEENLITHFKGITITEFHENSSNYSECSDMIQQQVEASNVRERDSNIRNKTGIIFHFNAEYPLKNLGYFISHSTYTELVMIFTTTIPHPSYNTSRKFLCLLLEFLFTNGYNNNHHIKLLMSRFQRECFRAKKYFQFLSMSDVMLSPGRLCMIKEEDIVFVGLHHLNRGEAFQMVAKPSALGMKEAVEYKKAVECWQECKKEGMEEFDRIFGGYGSVRTELANAMTALGISYRHMGKYQKAKKMYKKALKICELECTKESLKAVNKYHKSNLSRFNNKKLQTFDEKNEVAQTDTCAGCGKKEINVGRESRMMVCGKCKTIKFCSRECFERAWKKHKPMCKKICVMKKAQK